METLKKYIVSCSQRNADYYMILDLGVGNFECCDVHGVPDK